MQRKTFKTSDGVQLSYISAGRGQPIVLLPGWSQSAEQFKYQNYSLEDITEERFHRQFDLNVLGLLLTSQQGVKYFDSTGGNIINISSLVSTLPLPNGTIYGATEAAVDAITKSLSKELGSRNIRVNAINPSFIETEGTHAAGAIGSDFQKQVEDKPH